MIKRSEGVLHDIGLKFFERSNELVNTTFARDVEKVKDIERAGDSVIIQTASNETIVRDLDTRATFVTLYQKENIVRERVVRVPGYLADQIHDRCRSEVREVPFPSLDMVTGSPVLLPSGAVHSLNSNFEEGVMFVGAHMNQFPPIPEYPTRENALAAMLQFDEIFCGFPFVDPNQTRKWNETASYSVVLAARFQSLAARPHIGLGAIPLLIGATAPSRRSGKTKIVEAACMAALGHRPTACHYTDERSELA